MLKPTTPPRPQPPLSAASAGSALGCSMGDLARIAAYQVETWTPFCERIESAGSVEALD